MSLKNGIVDTLGKTIVGVVVKDRVAKPYRQVFFVFSDGTYFELYGDDIHGISSVRTGDHAAVLQYMSSGKVVIDARLDQATDTTSVVLS